MNSTVSDIFTTISAMRSMLENFPNGIAAAARTYSQPYSSITEFMIYLLNGAGITDKDIIDFILKELFGIKDVKGYVNEGIAKLPDAELNCEFLQKLEQGVKDVIALILSDLLSCSLIPRVSSIDVNEGFDIPLSSVDPMSLLNICPTEPMGRNVYDYITDEDTPGTMANAKDLNAFLWSLIYNNSDGQWDTRVTDITGAKPICNFTNSQDNRYDVINVKIDRRYLGKSFFNFNKDYLNSIELFSPKALITYLFDELVNGLPTFGVSLGIKEVINWGTVSTIIKKELENLDDYTYNGNDCSYTFSNEEWDSMLSDYELRKFDAKKTSTYGRAVQLDKDALMESINNVASGATKADALYQYETMLFDVTRIPGTETTTSTDFEVVANGWLSNIAINIIKPILRAVLTPKVMTLILINYQAAGLLNLTNINYLDSTAILDLIRRKMLSLIKALVRLIADRINEALLELFEKVIKPLIVRWNAKITMEKLNNYMLLLQSALECYRIYGAYTFADIEDVNYADIIPEKVSPEQTMC